jgi:hypothetical protein
MERPKHWNSGPSRLGSNLANRFRDQELYAAISDPAALCGAERKAWHGLSYWADDEDIRAKDAAYAPSRREQLADLLTNLERE